MRNLKTYQYNIISIDFVDSIPPKMYKTIEFYENRKIHEQCIFFERFTIKVYLLEVYFRL